MPFVKDPISLLLECSEADLLRDTKSAIKESTIVSNYNKIEELSESVVYTPEMVTIVKIGNEYYTEMNFLQPYMKSNGIKSIAEALNDVAISNNLAPKSVGLLIESKGSVTDKIKDAINSKNTKKKNAALDKTKKAEELVDKLKDDGFNVKTKKDEGCNPSSKKEGKC